MSQFMGPGSLPPVQTRTLWNWNTSSGSPVVSGYPVAGGGFSTTKTGLQPADLQAFVGVPLVYYGNPPAAINPQDIIQWIRYAEDEVESQTSILLCQTWVASPPTLNPNITQQCGLLVNTASGYQVQGYDYDLEDAAYDFMFKNAQDEGWMIQTLRYRPVQSMTYTPTDPTAIKSTSYVYPLLNTYFKIPVSWNVEDHDFGMVRFVPSVNVQMLPLFAMQLAFMGFAENVPGAIWFQYTAGLRPFDYQSRWSFMKQLVLAKAAITALGACQGTINLGALQIDTQVDGLRQQTRYDANGPYAGLIRRFSKMADHYMVMARSKIAGPMVTMI